MDVILGPLVAIIGIVIDLYVWALIISAVLSWLVAFNIVNTQNKFVYMAGDFLYRITEPLLGRIRRLLPNLGGIDLSPIVAILALIFLKDVLIRFYMKIV
jgi:YggT family protein